MKKHIDINCDLGETDSVDMEFLDSLMPYISSANISCGGHAGTKEVITATIEAAKRHGNAIGAHPSYPDKTNFGRQSMPLNKEAFEASMTKQLQYFYSLCQTADVKVHHIKPHGALYNDMAINEELAIWFIEFIKDFDPDAIIYGLAHSKFETLSISENLNFKAEGFLDRQYTPELKLVSRRIAGSVLTDPDKILNQLDQFMEGYLFIDAKEIKINIDTLCIHGDTKGAVLLAEKVFNHLKSKNIEITSA